MEIKRNVFQAQKQVKCLCHRRCRNYRHSRIGTNICNLFPSSSPFNRVYPLTQLTTALSHLLSVAVIPLKCVTCCLPWQRLHEWHTQTHAHTQPWICPHKCKQLYFACYLSLPRLCYTLSQPLTANRLPSMLFSPFYASISILALISNYHFPPANTTHTYALKNQGKGYRKYCRRTYQGLILLAVLNSECRPQTLASCTCNSILALLFHRLRM